MHIQSDYPFARICFFSYAGNSHDGLFGLSEWRFLSTAVRSWDSLFLCFVQVTVPNKQSVYLQAGSYDTWSREIYISLVGVKTWVSIVHG